MSAAAGPLVDTIAAPATAAGSGQRALVRLSGPRARSLIAAVLDLAREPAPGRLGTGRLDVGGGVTLDVELIAFHAPHSYTGEDVVEIHLPGWPVLVVELMRRLVAAGARPAARGEFTRRALANRRLDVRQAAAIGRLADAVTVEEASAAAAVLSGDLQRGTDELRSTLLDVLALIEAHVDFEEDDTEAVGEDDVAAALQRALEVARRLTAETPSARDGETDVVLLGAPNAGKSMLMLALCPGAATTVSPVAGTTRDALEAQLVHGERRYRLIDGPGIDQADPRLSDLDRAAMTLFLDQLPTGAVILSVEDAVAPETPSARAARLATVAGRPVIQVWNKCDLLAPSVELPETRRGGTRVPSVRTSAARREGLAELLSAVETAAPAPRAPELAGGEARRAAAAIVALLAPLEARPDGGGDPAVRLAGVLPLVALTVREALGALQTPDDADDVTEEVLDRIFASFCVGK